MQPFTLTGITANDVRTSDRDKYLQLVALLDHELVPHGAFEVLLAAEIVRASWRLQRYALADAVTESDTDRTSLDHARAYANNTIRRNTAELRRLQTERLVQNELGLNLPRMISLKEYFQLRNQKQSVVEAEKRKNDHTPTPASPPDSAAVVEMEGKLFSAIVKEEQSQLNGASKTQEMKIRTQSEPRNAPCGCGSGQKYKRCCGHWSKAA